jgi:regulation of enolase protein 1 (concanavalin A-like superfamily)
MSQYKFVNSKEDVPGDGTTLPAEFILKAQPSTDIWSKPPNTHSFTAPILYQSVPLHSFKRVRVAFNAQWKHKYDQGGLVLILHNKDGSRKWVKAGIELTHGKPHLSSVAKDNWSDWSLLPVPSGGGAATLEMVREADDSLWIYLVEGVQKSPIREITWIFEENDVQECWVGLYAARPGTEGGELEVNFGHLMIDLK